MRVAFLTLVLLLAFGGLDLMADVPKSGTSVLRLNDLGVAPSVREIRKKIDKVEVEIKALEQQIDAAEAGRVQAVAIQGVNSLNADMFESLKSQLELKRQSLRQTKTELNAELAQQKL